MCPPHSNGPPCWRAAAPLRRALSGMRDGGPATSHPRSGAQSALGAGDAEPGLTRSVRVLGACVRVQALLLGVLLLALGPFGFRAWVRARAPDGQDAPYARYAATLPKLKMLNKNKLFALNTPARPRLDRARPRLAASSR